MPQVEQELLTLPEHLSPPPVFSRVSVTLSLVLYVCFVDRCLSFCTFSFDHCFVCSSSICGFWLPLWYLQTLLTPIQLVYCRQFLLKCLYQTWKVSGHVFVLRFSILSLPLIFLWDFGTVSIVWYSCHNRQTVREACLFYCCLCLFTDP